MATNEKRAVSKPKKKDPVPTGDLAKRINGAATPYLIDRARGDIENKTYPGQAGANAGVGVGRMEFGGGLGAQRSGAMLPPELLKWFQQNDPYMDMPFPEQTMPEPAPTPSPQGTPESFVQALIAMLNQNRG
jgi:hypothetical protein